MTVHRYKKDWRQAQAHLQCFHPKEFLQDKSGKYDDSDEDWLKVAKTLELNSENGDFMYYHLSNSLYEILSCHYYSNN